MILPINSVGYVQADGRQMIVELTQYWFDAFEFVSESNINECPDASLTILIDRSHPDFIQYKKLCFHGSISRINSHYAFCLPDSQRNAKSIVSLWGKGYYCNVKSYLNHIAKGNVSFFIDDMNFLPPDFKDISGHIAQNIYNPFLRSTPTIAIKRIYFGAENCPNALPNLDRFVPLLRQEKCNVTLLVPPLYFNREKETLDWLSSALTSLEGLCDEVVINSFGCAGAIPKGIKTILGRMLFKGIRDPRFEFSREGVTNRYDFIEHTGIEIEGNFFFKRRFGARTTTRKWINETIVNYSRSCPTSNGAFVDYCNSPCNKKTYLDEHRSLYCAHGLIVRRNDFHAKTLFDASTDQYIYKVYHE